MHTTRNRLIDIVGVIGMLALAAALMYALLPQRTQPGQQVIPPLPASASDPTTTFLTIFVVMTMIGAPITIGLVLALIVRWLSRQVPASSAVAEAKAAKASAKPMGQGKPSVGAETPQGMSTKEILMWRLAAAGLSLVALGGLIVLFGNDIVRLFNPQ